jgi:hypothetical protein
VCSSSTARLIVKPSPDLRPYSSLPRHTSPLARFDWNTPMPMFMFSIFQQMDRFIHSLGFSAL